MPELSAMATIDELQGDERVQRAQDDLTGLVHWLNEHYTGIQCPGDPRARTANGCLDMALEHQMAIELLSRAGLFGSMLGLVRLTLESLIRGIWFARAASDEELARFQRTDNLAKSFETLVVDVERVIGNDLQTLLNLKRNSWDAMNSFTHTGMMQIVRRNSEEATGPNYSIDDVVTGLTLAGVLGLAASIEMATVCGNEALARATLERSREFAAR
jgi:hypothetical protein